MRILQAGLGTDRRRNSQPDMLLMKNLRQITAQMGT